MVGRKLRIIIGRVDNREHHLRLDIAEAAGK
jgi:hypothetical protein